MRTDVGTDDDRNSRVTGDTGDPGCRLRRRGGRTVFRKGLNIPARDGAAIRKGCASADESAAGEPTCGIRARGGGRIQGRGAGRWGDILVYPAEIFPKGLTSIVPFLIHEADLSLFRLSRGPLR